MAAKLLGPSFKDSNITNDSTVKTYDYTNTTLKSRCWETSNFQMLHNTELLQVLGPGLQPENLAGIQGGNMVFVQHNLQFLLLPIYPHLQHVKETGQYTNILHACLKWGTADLKMYPNQILSRD